MTTDTDTRMTESLPDSESDIETSGIVAQLGELGPGAVIQQKALCEMFDRTPDSVKRAVQNGDLPPPVRLFGQNTWTAGKVVQHLEMRQEQAAKKASQKAEDVRRTMLELAP